MERKPVVVGVDDSPGSRAAVRWGARLAARDVAPLALVHGVWAIRSAYGGEDALFEHVAAAGRRCLDTSTALALEIDPDLVVTVSMPLDTPAPTAIIEVSQQASIVVVGHTGATHHLGGLLGSTAYAVASRAHCPVAVVPGDDDVSEDGPVVIGVDGGPQSEQVLEVAFQHAAHLGVPLLAVRATTDLDDGRIYETADFVMPRRDLDRDESRRINDLLTRWEQKFPDVPLERRVVMADPRDTLISLSANAQVIVVGSRGRAGYRRMRLGSTSHALIEHAECPVIVVRTGGG